MFYTIYPLCAVSCFGSFIARSIHDREAVVLELLLKLHKFKVICDKMEGSCSLSGTMRSAATRRLKMLACLLIGTIVLSATGADGCLSYRKVVSKSV